MTSKLEYDVPPSSALEVDNRRNTFLRVSTSVDPDTDAGVLARAVHDGLRSQPKFLPFTLLYDDVGSTLFEQICRLPEYYLTRTEDAILRENAAAMVSGWNEPPTLIELGSGSAEKTRRLITALLAEYGRLHYVPIDVSRSALEESSRRLIRTFSSLRVTNVHGDYHQGLTAVFKRIRGPKLVTFLGSSLGNYDTEDARALLRQVGRQMGSDDRFLLGTDLAKDATILEPAYDDSQGVTARFNRNLLVRINRELRGDFEVDQFRHQARYHPERGRVELHLVSLRDQAVSIPGAGLVVNFKAGELIHTENSHKYTIDSLGLLAEASHFEEELSWSDPLEWFRVQRWRIRPSAAAGIQ